MRLDDLKPGARVCHCDGRTEGEIVRIIGDWLVIRPDAGGPDIESLAGEWEVTEKVKERVA